MLTSERKEILLARLRNDGRIVAKTIAEEFDLSEDTIRRDLREMAADRLLTRVHGGALPISPDLPDFAERRGLATDEKRRLGEAGARLIQPGQLVFLDGGTTNSALARALPRHFAFTVVTHSPTIAADLETHPTAEVHLIGGRLFKHSMVAVGAAAAAAIDQIRPDIFFLGATALHPRHGFSTGDVEEAAIKRRIAGQSSRTWVLITAGKIDAVSPVTILPIQGVTGIVATVADQLTDYVAAGLKVETA